MTRPVFLDADDPKRMRAIANGLRARGYSGLAKLVGQLVEAPHPAKHHEAFMALQRLPAHATEGLPLTPGPNWRT